MPSFIAGDYYYVLLTDRRIIYAKIKSDGSLDSWQTATAQHNEGGGRGYTAVVIDNIPYLLRFGRVEKLVINASGNVTEIQQVGASNGVGDNYYYWDSAVVTDFGTNKYVFILGGFDCCDGAHYSTNNLIFRSSASTTPWQWQAMGEGAHQNPYKAVFYKPSGANYGYIYVGDLHKENSFNPAYPDHLYRVKVKNDGSFDTGWTLTADFPAKDPTDQNSFGEIFVSGSTLFVIRGKKVYSATINTDGTLTSWDDSPTDLPGTQINKNWGPSQDADHTDGTSVGIKNNFVYITDQDKVYYTQIGGSVPSASPNPTATTGPVPTLAPCSGPRNSLIKFSIQIDTVKDIDNFNDAGGLSLIGINNTKHCFTDAGPINVTLEENNLVVTNSPVSLPDGTYTIILWASRNLKQKYDNIKLTADSTLDCTGQAPADCGGLSPQIQIREVLYSGDINNDNIINAVDFELYRQNIGSTTEGNNADLDYNGKVEYKNGVDDDFYMLKNNFGRTGYNSPVIPAHIGDL